MLYIHTPHIHPSFHTLQLMVNYTVINVHFPFQDHAINGQLHGNYMFHFPPILRN